MSGIGQISCECETTTACCQAVASEPIDATLVEDLAAGFKALGDPYRVAIVHLLNAAAGPVCVVDIERHVPLSQSTVSYHLKFLVDAGVLDRERQGRWSYYRVRHERLASLTRELGSFNENPATAAT